MFKDWNFKALGLKNASFDENMMLIAFVNLKSATALIR